MKDENYRIFSKPMFFQNFFGSNRAVFSTFYRLVKGNAKLRMEGQCLTDLKKLLLGK